MNVKAHTLENTYDHYPLRLRRLSAHHSSPQWIFAAHRTDQIADLAGNGRPTRPCRILQVQKMGR